jgi:hypothetical protein
VSFIFLGGHQAVGLMATHDNPIQVTNSIAFTIDTTDQAFDLTAYTLFCAGLLSLAWIALRQGRAAWAAWAGYTALLAVLALVIAWSYGAGGGDVTNDLLFAGGQAGDRQQPSLTATAAARRAQRGLILRLACSSTTAVKPGCSGTVAPYSSITAGPATTSPAVRACLA